MSEKKNILEKFIDLSIYKKWYHIKGKFLQQKENHTYIKIFGRLNTTWCLLSTSDFFFI